MHRLAAATGFLLAVAVLLWCMATISAWVTRGQLSHDAQATWTTLRQGQPLWSWTLRQPADVVARRVFGSAILANRSEGLEFTSPDGSPFEVGLPLAAPVDLAHWPWLQLRLHGSATGSLGLSYQTTEHGLRCDADDAATLAPGSAEPRIDLRSLRWRSADGTTCPPPGAVMYLLRLRLQIPAHASLQIGEASLLATTPIRLPEHIAVDAADIHLPLALEDGRRALAAPGDWSAPVVRLPAHASAEAMLILRDLALERWPAAVVLPFGQPLQSAGGSPWPLWLDWLALVLYLVALVWLLRRQTVEIQHPWLEVAAIAAGPLWLIAGLRWGSQASIPGVVAFVAALTYAGISEWRRRPTYWSWLPQRRAEWWWPLLPLPVAFALTLLDGHGLTHLPWAHVAAYFGWALLQQWAMLAIVMGRLQHTRLPRPVIILLTAGLFALLHTPNGTLMQLCLLAELWWAWCFMRAPRLVPIAVAHALSALLVESALTGHLLRSLEVGARFFL
ncbi:CPBP family glutamic-type intramembrane protease [Dyella sp. C9]|uniref:CPBP family glutamic-type intramembrane protease n=1 Tax=Dyella sp. C9 TaxID=2202154 RepID=UPI000DEEC8D3|nr:CPBP family glutamic-type intramembrane protease [Dyella sp. C9]